MFHVAIGAGLVVGGCLLVPAIYGESPLLAARTAAQITGWLFISALLLDLCAITLRARGLRNVPRPAFGQAVAGVTTLFTGALILYVSYFEWSEFPAVPMREAAAAEALPRGMPDPSFMPPAVAAVHTRPAAPRRSVDLLVGTAGALHAPDEEQTRLERCADRQGDDALCPSPIPASPPY
jgi:hypothetical protein